MDLLWWLLLVFKPRITAESICSEMDSDLVTVHNQEENVFIQHRHAGDRSWIGLNDRSVEGSFVWTNKEISSFRFWTGTTKMCAHSWREAWILLERRAVR